jgi:hypothetical protein
METGDALMAKSGRREQAYQCGVRRERSGSGMTVDKQFNGDKAKARWHLGGL